MEKLIQQPGITSLSKSQVSSPAPLRGQLSRIRWRSRAKPKRIALEEAIRLVLVRRGHAVVETEFGKALGGAL